MNWALGVVWSLVNSGFMKGSFELNSATLAARQEFVTKLLLRLFL
jgi:hypothetical protein